ncbi:hypothetical protein BV20DRAFT_903407, partial [Pilatotrama ljubarskyi]
RPPNSFILFRKRLQAKLYATFDDSRPPGSLKGRPRQSELSVIIAREWRALSQTERRYWDGLAHKATREHMKTYPDYVYRP